MSNEIPDLTTQGTAPTATGDIQATPPNLTEWFGYNAGFSLSDNAPGTSSSNTVLSPEHQKSKMQSIVEIFELQEEHEKEDEEMGDDYEEESVVDFEDQQRRTERLRGVFPALQQLWRSNSEYMDLAAEKLGNGSRDRKSPRPKHLLVLLLLTFSFLLLLLNKSPGSLSLSYEVTC